VDSVMKELMGAMPHPQNFWARTAPGCVLSIPSASSADHGQELYPFELANVAYSYSVNPKTIDDNVVTFSFINYVSTLGLSSR